MAGDGSMDVRVECYSGYRGEETPRRVLLGRQALDVAEVVDRWYAPECRYFKVRGVDDTLLILRHGQDGLWDLVMYKSERADCPAAAHASPTPN